VSQVTGTSEAVLPQQGGGPPPSGGRRALNVATRPTVYLPLLNLLLFLLVWEIVGRQIDPLLFAPPSTVFAAFGGLLESGELLSATATTLNALVVGFLISVGVGIPVGIVLGRADVLRRVVDPYLDAIYATPRVVIVPIIVLWFGVGYTGRLFLIFIGATIPIIVSTAVGVRNARPDLMEVAYSFGANPQQTVRHVQLPGAVPYVTAGLRIAAERAVVGVVIGEIFLELTGLGGLIQVNAQAFDVPEMLCAVIVIAAIGTAFMGLLDLLEKHFSSWKAQG
jgi:ABC-type nitrate/sulfonate/bicarbonate transport system permease component